MDRNRTGAQTAAVKAAAVATVVAMAVALVTGCGVLVSNPVVTGRAGEPSAPLTPQRSRDRVVAAAREIVAQLGVPVTEAYFWRASCNDAGRPPLRGRIRIAYPLAASSEASRNEIQDMIRRLRDTGWGADPDFHSHSPAVYRDDVVLVFHNQNPAVPTRNIMVLGGCRDVVPMAPGGEPVEAISVR